MKVAFISDIHANFTALCQALETADRLGVEKVVAAGDLIGRGAHPVEVIRMLAEHFRNPGAHPQGILLQGLVKIIAQGMQAQDQLVDPSLSLCRRHRYPPPTRPIRRSRIISTLARNCFWMAPMERLPLMVSIR